MSCVTRFNSWATTLSCLCNDLNKVSDVLDPIMFADDTNLFYSHQNVKTLFGTVNCELEKNM